MHHLNEASGSFSSLSSRKCWAIAYRIGNIDTFANYILDCLNAYKSHSGYIRSFKPLNLAQNFPSETIRGSSDASAGKIVVADGHWGSELDQKGTHSLSRIMPEH